METVLHVITGLNLGGAESELYRMVTVDKSRRHEVVSILGGGFFEPKLKAKGIAVRSLGAQLGKIGPRSVIQLFRVMKEVDPDLVQTWMPHGNLLGGVVAKLATRAKIVWGLHNSAVGSEARSWKTRAVIWLGARLSGGVPDRIISCSNAGRNSYVSVGYRPEKFSVIPNGYDFEKFTPNAADREVTRHDWSVRENEIVLGIVGRWHPHKDHANLVGALSLLNAQELADWRCIMVGPGISEDNSSLMELIRKYGLEDRVQLLGPQTDIPAIMNGFDIHILSSVSEAFPNVLVEAMAYRTPSLR